MFVAGPGMGNFRRMFEGVLPRATQDVGAQGAAAPAVKHPGACEQVIPGT